MAARRRPLVALVTLLAALAPLSLIPAHAAAVEPPTLRLFVASTEITVERDRQDWVYVDPGAWVMPVGGAFELLVSRPDYDTPVTIKQVDAETREVLRTISAEYLEGWNGLANFARAEVLDARGNALVDQTMPFCPNSYVRQRVSDQSPLTPRYPFACWASSPFTKGMLWGIEEGWASSLLGDPYYGLSWQAERRNFTMRFTIDPSWVELLGIAPEDASAEVHVIAVDGGGGSPDPIPASFRPAVEAPTPFPATPIVTNPDPDTLPDLVATPAWGISIYTRRGHDLLAFNATEWNAGPGTMVVEGFRGTDDETMDGFQYFVADGEALGRAEVGELEYHRGGGHNHWHFEEFTRYSLLDTNRNLVQPSGKQSWCLVNTDALDLTVPNANLMGYGSDLATSCGGSGALWVREVLDVGWGDTYSQFVRGQAFDITDLPNGTYYIRVHVNPTDALYEITDANNVEDRLIRLRGKPGHRRVVVPPWHGIDTEGYCGFCG